MTEIHFTLPAEAVEEIVELVAARIERRAEDRRDDDEIEYLTTAEYAKRYKTTAAAVLARIHRKTLHAIRPPGGREWLIPVKGPDDDAD